MPVSYTIDPVTRIIHTRLVGEVDGDQVRSHFDELLADPACPDRLLVLLDTMEMHTMLTPELIRTCGEQVARVRQRVRFDAVSIATPGLAQYGMFRMSQVLLERHFGQIAVFRDLDAALTWLHALVRAGI